MFPSRKALVACALLSFSPLCLADFYLGASGAMTEYSKYDDVGHGFGGQVFGGYRPASFPMVFELGYLQSGKSKVDNYSDGVNTLTNTDLSFDGTLASVGYYGRFDRKGSGGFAKLGYYTGKSKVSGNINGTDFSGSQTSNGVMFALGVDWMLTPYFGFRADIGSLLSVKDIPQFDPGHKSNITTANIGVVFAFGHPETASPARVRRRRAVAESYVAPAVAQSPVSTPAPEPTPAAVPPAAYAPEPTPVAAPVPVAAPPPPAAAVEPAPAPAAPASTATADVSGNAQALPGAVVRAEPSMKGATVRLLKDGGNVSLIKRIAKTDGPWWSVKLDDGTTGWMIEWALTGISKN